MSDAYLVRRSGGSDGLSPDNAVIHVTAHTGSTISFTKGGIIVKTLGPDKSHILSTNSLSAEWYYSISSYNYGEWTITSTLDDVSKSKAISVNENKQYDVILSTLYLFNYGAVPEYTFTRGGGGGSLSTSGEYIYLSADTGAESYAEPRIPVDITNYSTLYINVRGASSYGDGRCKLYISKTFSMSMTAYVSAYSIGQCSLDISSYSGDYYIGIYIKYNSNWSAYQIWLE